MTDREAFNEAMADANAKPRDLMDDPLPGLPSDPFELRAYLAYVEYAAFGRRPEFNAQVKASTQDWLAGGDGMGPWND